jgi:hypothetical protein
MFLRTIKAHCANYRTLDEEFSLNVQISGQITAQIMLGKVCFYTHIFT